MSRPYEVSLLDGALPRNAEDIFDTLSREYAALPPSPGSREGQVFEITFDHRYRDKVYAIPDAYWDKERGAYCLVNPSKRAARAAIALFPDVLNRHPELAEVSNELLAAARPTDYATQVGRRLEVDLEGIELYPWQDTDLGYIRAILERDGGGNLLWDRGLGKTLASAGFIKKLGCARTLVVCRNDAKVPVWRNQLADLLPEHRLWVLPNPKPKRELMLAALEHDPPAPLVFIVHYEALALIAGDKGKGAGWDRLGTWDLMVFDEGHRLASMNPNSPGKNTQLGKATMKVRKLSTMALNLTGTSIMNHAEDLFGGRVHVVERGPALAVDQLPVDQQSTLTRLVSHGVSPEVEGSVAP